jgi:multidrug efflux system membrane fusion protein
MTTTWITVTRPRCSAGPASAAPPGRFAAPRRLLHDWPSRCLLTVLIVIVGCRRTGSEGGRSSPAEAFVPVAVAVVEQRDVPVQIRAIGTVEPYRTVPVKSQVQGELTEVRFVEGQFVKTGDILFVIDPRPFEVAQRLAEATLAKDTALAKDSEAEASRLAGLYGKAAAGQRESEQARAAADAGWAQVDADRAAVDRAKLNLEYCTIRAPFDGFAGGLLVHQGAILKVGDTEMVTLNQVSPIYAAFAVPEQDLAEIRANNDAKPLEVEAAHPGETGPVERGQLSFIDNEADRTTGTIRLKATFANEQHRLWPGQFVNVVLTVAVEKGAVGVPTQAIQTGQAGQYVFVVKPDDSVEMRPVKPGREVAGWTVVADGLQPGETVVTDGQLRLVAGTKVQRKSEGKTDAASQPTTRTGLGT